MLANLTLIFLNIGHTAFLLIILQPLHTALIWEVLHLEVREFCLEAFAIRASKRLADQFVGQIMENITRYFYSMISLSGITSSSVS